MFGFGKRRVYNPVLEVAIVQPKIVQHQSPLIPHDKNEAPKNVSHSICVDLPPADVNVEQQWEAAS